MKEISPGFTFPFLFRFLIHFISSDFFSLKSKWEGVLLCSFVYSSVFVCVWSEQDRLMMVSETWPLCRGPTCGRVYCSPVPSEHSDRLQLKERDRVCSYKKSCVYVFVCLQLCFLLCVTGVYSFCDNKTSKCFKYLRVCFCRFRR